MDFVTCVVSQVGERLSLLRFPLAIETIGGYTSKLLESTLPFIKNVGTKLTPMQGIDIVTHVFGYFNLANQFIFYIYSRNASPPRGGASSIYIAEQKAICPVSRGQNCNIRFLFFANRHGVRASGVEFAP